MKESMLLLLLLVLLGLFEFGLWTGNPMHVPSGFVPARAFGLQVFQELGGSMEPAVPVGRHVLVAAWPYWWREPQVGDVIGMVCLPTTVLPGAKLHRPLERARS